MKARTPVHAHASLALRAARYNPALPAGEVVAAIRGLVRCENALSALSERDCECGLSARQEKRRDKIETDAALWARPLGMIAVCQRDPRGPAIRLYRLGEPDTGSGISLY